MLKYRQPRNLQPNQSSFSLYFTLFTVLTGLFLLFLITATKLSSPTQKTAPIQSRAATSAASSWSDEEQVGSNYLPTTPLVADVNATYPNKEISYINGDGGLVIYAASGGNPIVNATDVAGTLTALVTNGELALSAIHLDSDNYYEILAPGRVGTGTTRQGTLKAFKGNGSAVSGINTSFSQGLPISAPLVEDLDSDGNPEIILPVYHDINATTSLLGWTWINGQLTGLNSGSPVLITVSGSGAKFSAPSAGNITSTNVSVKEVAAALENPDGTMSIYVFAKNGTAIQQIPSAGAWYQEAINEPIPGTSSNGTNPGIGGIALADLGGDAKQEVVAVTHKKVGTNPWGGYVVRVFSHNATQGSGQIFTSKLETGIVNGVYLGTSRPSIGKFQGQNKAIVFHTNGTSAGNDNGRGLFAAYYNGSALAWSSGYSPRTITSKDGSVCNVKTETSLSTITLGDSNNDQLNEAIYAKYYSGSSTVYTLFFYYAQGSPADDPSCTRALDQFDVTSPLGLQNPGGISKRIEAISSIELSDLDNDGLLEMATTYAYQNVNNYNRLYVQEYSGPASSVQDWPMAAGNECRQGRYRGSCPPAPSGTAPTRTPTPTIEPKFACNTDSDCGCAFDTTTSQCAFLNKSYPNQKACTWPDFCSGITGDCYPACVWGRCFQYCPSLLPSPTPTPVTISQTFSSCTYNLKNIIPGRIEAENFTCAGQGKAYNDKDSTNNGKSYRPTEAVDIQSATDNTGGAYNIGWTREREWLRYKVNVQTAGTYSFTFRVAANNPVQGTKFRLSRVKPDGTLTTLFTKAVPNTQGFQNWTNVTVTGISLPAGIQTLQLSFPSFSGVSSSTSYGNYNYFTVK